MIVESLVIGDDR